MNPFTYVNLRLSTEPRTFLNVRTFSIVHFVSSSSIAYLDEQEKALEYIRETPDLSVEEKKKFFKSANTNLGIPIVRLSDYSVANTL